MESSLFITASFSPIAIQAYNLEDTPGQASFGGLREMVHNEVTPSKLSSAAKQHTFRSDFEGKAIEHSLYSS
jgi:hypothetical protein